MKESENCAGNDAIRIREEQRLRWSRGERVWIESLVDGDGGWQADRDRFLDLVSHEIALREENGEAPACEEYATRFPERRVELEGLFHIHRAFSLSGATVSLAAEDLRSTVLEERAGGAERVDWSGRSFSHYKVENRLGAGGMGEVYLAQDLALGRPAAIKFLPGNFSPSMRARLLSEAQTSARLQHPGIATFYEAGEPDGVAFIAMEYVAGETLRQRLRKGALPLNQALGVVAGLLAALGHAHALGILHRDIKPENIMLTGEGIAKLLDFGIAKELLAGPKDFEACTVSGSGSAGQTLAGAVIGTPGYMAPEQVEGQLLDARADLFSVGLVLYETVVGRPLFGGATVAARMAATLAADWQSLEDRQMPGELRKILSRVLMRDRSRRYPSAAAFLRDLRELGVHERASLVIDSIAVLDLENVSGRTGDEWIGPGFADALRKNLTGVGTLRVVNRERIVRTGEFRQRSGLPLDAWNLGLALGSRWVVSGDFERTEWALRIRAQLMDAATGQVEWSDEVTGETRGLLKIQERLFEGLVWNMNLQKAAPPKKTEGDARVYEYYIRGQQRWWTMDKSRLEQAQEFFEQAIALDPHYAPALAGLAAIHALRITFTSDPATLELAEGFARRAIRADPGLGESYTWLSYIEFQRGNSLGAYTMAEKALELDPGSHLAAYFMGSHLAIRSFHRSQAQEFCKRIGGGRVTGDPHHWLRTRALELLQRAVEIDSAVNTCWLALSIVHLELGNFAESEWCIRQTLERKALVGWPGMEGYLGECLRRKGALEEARVQCLAGLEAIEKSDAAYRDTMRGTFFCSLGRTALQQGDVGAAHTAFTQGLLHLRGRHRAKGGGHLLVQALAGVSEAGAGPEPFEEALQLFLRREGYNFSDFWCCTDAASLLGLARAARKLGRVEEARQLLVEALDAGSTEAKEEVMT